MSAIGGVTGNVTGTVSAEVGGVSDEAKALAEKKRLTDAAQQFEAMFLQEMLKPMRVGGDGEDGDKDPDASPGSDTMSSFGTEAVAGAIAKGGGLGIARQIVAKVSKERFEHSIRKS